MLSMIYHTLRRATNEVNEPKYQYPPLAEDDGIRILLLEPACCRDDDLKGSLQEISLAQQRDDLIDPYTALSYVWGDSTRCDRILIDNCELGITKNLSAALRDLRDPSRTHRVWADAACIDQENDLEKSRQVALMGEIFSGANHTVIYLGPPNPCVNTALEWMKQNIDSDKFRDIGPIRFPPGPTIELTSEDISFVDAVYEGILVNPWCRRIWVLQELILSKEPWVQFGRKRVRWAELSRFLARRLELRRIDNRLPQTDFETMDDLRIEYRKVRRRRGYGSDLYCPPIEETSCLGLKRLSLMDILLRRKGCEVSDPRDLIFAHMGIISDRQQAEKFIKIDYDKTISEVFAAAGCYIYSCFGPIYMINQITPSPLRALIPSWAPDWGVRIDQDNLRGKTSSSHALSIGIGRAAKIRQLSDVLPAPSSFNRRFTGVFSGIAIFNKSELPSWEEIVRFLSNTNEGNIGNVADLDSWPREMLALIRDRKQWTSGFQTGPLGPLLAHYLCDWYRDQDSVAGLSRSRLALLSDGNAIIVPSEVLISDIAVRFQDSRELIVRPCEPQATVDLNGVDLKDGIYRHGSLVGFGGPDIKTHLRDSFHTIQTLFPNNTPRFISSPDEHPFMNAWMEPFIDGWSGGLEGYLNRKGVLMYGGPLLPSLVLY